MKLLTFNIIVLMSAALAAAIPAQQITWNQSDPNAQVLIYTLTISEEGNPVPRVVPLLNTLCNKTECSTALPVNGQSAIVTGNSSVLTAKNPQSGLISAPSAPFIGNQGCIFRDNLYVVGNNATANTNKQGLNALLMEFQRAKFKHISTTAKGNNITVTEQCVGFIVK